MSGLDSQVLQGNYHLMDGDGERVPSRPSLSGTCPTRFTHLRGLATQEAVSQPLLV